MNIFEKIIYFVLFILNKYIGLMTTESILDRYEKRMIRKYVPQNEIDPSEIPTIQASELTDEKFRLISNNYRRPVLIKGFMKDTPAVNNWDLEYLKGIIHDFEVNALIFDPELRAKKISFSEFVDRSDSEIYINNNHTILSKFPTLFDDIHEKYTELIGTLTSTNLRNIHIANLFIGVNDETRRPSGSNMHCGGSGNFFCQIRGKKTWTLIDPIYSPLLKGRVSPSGIHAQTLFDMPDIPLSEYPEIFKHLPRYEVTLEPGDVLWNAPWWWHRILNHSGLSIGMAIRNNKVTKLNLLNNPTYTLSGYTYLLYNTLLISAYEKLFCKSNEHFGASHEEQKKDNVLYQIDALNKRYPHSTTLAKTYEKNI